MKIQDSPVFKTWLHTLREALPADFHIELRETDGHDGDEIMLMVHSAHSADCRKIVKVSYHTDFDALHKKLVDWASEASKPGSTIGNLKA